MGVLNDFIKDNPLTGYDDKSGEVLDLLRRNQDLYSNIDVPDQQYNPEMYQYGGDVQSQTIDENPLIKSAQMAYLNKLSGLADTGMSAADEAGYQHAREIGSQMSRAGTQNAISDARRRGVAGSGMEFAMREMANQEGAGRAQNAGLQQAADAARMRELYNRAYGDYMSNVRNQDYQANAANTGIINRFNELNTNRRDAVSQHNVDTRNNAQQYRNNLGQQKFDNQIRKAGGQAGVNNDLARGYADQGAANAAQANQMNRMLFQGGMAAMGVPTAQKKPQGTQTAGGSYFDTSDLA